MILYSDHSIGTTGYPGWVKTIATSDTIHFQSPVESGIFLVAVYDSTLTTSLGSAVFEVTASGVVYKLLDLTTGTIWGTQMTITARPGNMPIITVVNTTTVRHYRMACISAPILNQVLLPGAKLAM